ncbi:MAG: metallophosphoesterase family protein [Desulfurococcales archaeon]|nr:metallophosphoesterase family protein [Desulfurococcales archaeon]
MRILHVSDMHCRTDLLLKVLEEEEYDIAIASGDFECVDTAQAFARAVKGRGYAVTGNLDDPSVARTLREHGVLIDGTLVEFEGLKIGGVGGIDVAGSLEALERRLKERKVDVLVSHHPPKGILDRTFFRLRIGLREIGWLVEKLNPRVHLFGHVHESRGVEERGGVLFVNAGPLKSGHYAVIECDSGLENCRAELRRLS